MAEGGGAIDSDVKPIQAEEVVKPERTLNQSVKETAAFLGISEAGLERLSTQLPLRLSDRNSVLARGTFGTIIENDKVVGEIAFQSDEALNSDLLIDLRTRDEETTHYLHAAA